jgi:6-phosphogluconolactonase
MKRSIVVFRDAKELAAGAADHIVRILRDSLESRPRASLVLTGGGTPRETYALLADVHRDSLDWRRVDIFWGDDRFVPPEHPESNFRMANTALLFRLRTGAVFPIPTTVDSPLRSASEYERTIRGYFGDDEIAFDITLLGLGKDAHVASLFPGAAAFDELERLVVQTIAPEGSPIRDRISMTYAALNTSRNVLFLVSGEGKHPAVHRVLAAEDDTPAGRIIARERLIWCLDEAAAGDLPEEVLSRGV